MMVVEQADDVQSGRLATVADTHIESEREEKSADFCLIYLCLGPIFSLPLSLVSLTHTFSLLYLINRPFF